MNTVKSVSLHCEKLLCKSLIKVSNCKYTINKDKTDKNGKEKMEMLTRHQKKIRRTQRKIIALYEEISKEEPNATENAKYTYIARRFGKTREGIRWILKKQKVI